MFADQTGCLINVIVQVIEKALLCNPIPKEILEAENSW